jgi:hypothetical protein
MLIITYNMLAYCIGPRIAPFIGKWAVFQFRACSSGEK